jgi:hypothetical protein
MFLQVARIEVKALVRRGAQFVPGLRNICYENRAKTGPTLCMEPILLEHEEKRLLFALVKFSSWNDKLCEVTFKPEIGERAS